MSITTDIIAFGVRIVAQNTSLIRQPSSFESFIDSIVENETYDYRIARRIENETARVVNSVKRVNTDRKFKKIVENV